MNHRAVAPMFCGIPRPASHLRKVPISGAQCAAGGSFLSLIQRVDHQVRIAISHRWRATRRDSTPVIPPPQPSSSAIRPRWHVPRIKKCIMPTLLGDDDVVRSHVTRSGAGHRSPFRGTIFFARPIVATPFFSYPVKQPDGDVLSPRDRSPRRNDRNAAPKNLGHPTRFHLHRRARGPASRLRSNSSSRRRGRGCACP